MDKIIIDKLKVFCHHGVFEDEQLNGQNFYVSAKLSIDAITPGKSDKLMDSVNYAKLCEDITCFMQNNRYDLIEAVAQNLCAYILDNNELIKSIQLRIDKPEAPIGLPFESVAVEIERGWHKAYIAFGSNMGDSMTIIRNGLDELSRVCGIKILKESSIIRTKPYGGVEQDDFLNGCVSIMTRLSPYELLDELHTIENNAGRTREIHWGPRTLDLDIILYDEEIIYSDRLIIPHIDMANREFVLKPLCELAPYAYNPVTRMTAEEMLKHLNI